MPSDVVFALSEALSISNDEADRMLLNSEAFQEMRDETIKMREAMMKAFEEDADEAFDTPDGRRIIHIDLTKNDPKNVKDNGDTEKPAF